MRIFHIFSKTRHRHLRVYLGEIRADTLFEAMKKAQLVFQKSIHDLDLIEL